MKKNNALKTILIILFSLLSLISLPVLLRAFLFEVRWIPSGSMEPTLNGNPDISQANKVIVNKLSYKFSNPIRGDIIVFSPTETLRKENYTDAFTSRVIGLPGEKVELKGGKVYINGQPIQENYVAPNSQTQIDVCLSASQPPYLAQAQIIPPNSYLTLGDNRTQAYDSRCWGTVPKNNIIGKVTNVFTSNWQPRELVR